MHFSVSLSDPVGKETHLLHPATEHSPKVEHSGKFLGAKSQPLQVKSQVSTSDGKRGLLVGLANCFRGRRFPNTRDTM